MKKLILELAIFVFGFAAGSFLKQIPAVSAALQKCECKSRGREKLLRYPAAGLANGVGYLLVVHGAGFRPVSVLYGLCASALLVLAVVDAGTYEIPLGCSLFIGGLGVIRLFFNLSCWQEYVGGFFAVSSLLFVLHLLTRGNGIGGGDIKLMAAAGLLLGWEKILLAMAVGSAAGLGIHAALMMCKRKGHVLALGPYLAAGIFFAMLYGEKPV